MAAAPGQSLPLFPEPIYNFAGPHFLDVEVDGRRFAPTNVRPGAPRRALTVWDAISDLPPISSGHDEVTSRYTMEPRTHLQMLYRANESPILEDHISKDVNALCQERINKIPKIPGSDWRDLPNIPKVLEDGKVVEKLR